MTAAIRVERLTRFFGQVRALHDLNLEIRAGEVFGLLGPNGAGKTTTIRVLGGVLRPSSGEARVLGLDPVAHGDEVRRRIGVLTENPSLYERLSAFENLAFFARLHGIPAASVPARVMSALDTFGLADRAADRAGTLSRGLKQRLALARAVLHDPGVVFLDEPTAALDPESARQVTSVIERLSGDAGRTIVLCTHHLDEAARLCHRVAVLRRGEVLAVGSPRELADALWPERWVDVELEPPVPAGIVSALRSGGAALDARLAGSRLEVRVTDAGATPAVVAALVSAGARVTRVNPREHALEDAYFELQRRGAGDGAVGPEGVRA